MNTLPDREHQPEIEDALEAMFQTPTPSDDFADRLERQLVAQAAVRSTVTRPSVRRWQTGLTSRPPRSGRFTMFWQHTRRLVSGAVALAALLLLVVGLIALFSNAHQLTTTNPTPTPAGPQLKMDGSITQSLGPIGSQQIPLSVRAPLPQLPDRVPLYEIKAAIDKPSPEVARAWAEKLGLGTVRVYREGESLEAAYVALTEDGRMVRVDPMGQVMYQVDVSVASFPLRPQPSAPDPDKAQAVAEAFLNGMPDLFVVEGDSAASTKVTSRVEPSPYQAPETQPRALTFQYTPLIDGIPASSHGSSGEGAIIVGADDQVLIATFTPLRITSTGKEVTLRPIETVVRAFLDGDQTVLRGSGSGSTLAGSPAVLSAYHFRTPSFTVGENVTLRGYVQHWSSVDGGPDLYFVSTSGPQMFILEGRGLDATQPLVEVKGRIAGQTQSGAWRIEVAASQALEPRPDAIPGFTGILRRLADGAQLEIDGGQAYRLPDPPTGVPDGERVTVSGALVEDGTVPRLEWQIMLAASELPSGSAASGVGVLGPVSIRQWSQVAAATVAPPVEPTQVISASEQTGDQGPVMAAPAPVYPNGAPVSGVFQSVTSGSSETVVTPTLPGWWTYQPGDEVTLEGELSAQGYRIRSSSAPADQSATPTPDRLVFNAQLVVRHAGDQADELVPLTLVGDQVDVDLIRLDGLHVRVWGRLLSSVEALQRYSNLTGQSFPGLALEVTRFEKAQPGETKAVLSGQIRVETLDDQEVAIFSDTLSNQEYVLANSLTFTPTLEMYREQAKNKETLAVIGVVAPGETFAGRSILQVLTTHSGMRDPAEVVKGLRDELEDPIQDVGPAPDTPTDLTVDRVELVYLFQVPPSRVPLDYQLPPTELRYLLSGHSPDGRITVSYELEAAQ